MSDSRRKRKRPGPVISISRGDDGDESDASQPLNRNITLARQGRRLTQLSAPISAGTSEDLQEEPSPWSAQFYDEVYEDPPLPIIEEDVPPNVRIYLPVREYKLKSNLKSACLYSATGMVAISQCIPG